MMVPLKCDVPHDEIRIWDIEINIIFDRYKNKQNVIITSKSCMNLYMESLLELNFYSFEIISSFVFGLIEKSIIPSSFISEIEFLFKSILYIVSPYRTSIVFSS